MGGHDHHHHVELPKVPDPNIYKVEESPNMTRLQKRLAAKGLSYPWARNEVWRCQLKKKVSWLENTVFLDLCTKGWKIWVPLLILTIATEKYFGISYHGHVNHNILRGRNDLNDHHNDHHGGHH